MGHSGRVLGVDLGRRRIGLAISDCSGTVARPLTTLQVGAHNALDRVVAEVDRLASEEDGLAGIVVGVPRGLDGKAHEQTAATAVFMEALRARTPIPVRGEDERLTSREAESRLATRERHWRKRKAKLDAAAATIILQDYLDRRPSADRPAGRRRGCDVRDCHS